MFAEIIAIGSELSCGSKLDTNSQWLSRELENLGWTVIRHTTLADDMSAIVCEFRAAVARARVVLITGGLGPTLDDITREALCEAFDQNLIRDSESLRTIQELFVAHGRKMPERNERQADRPEYSMALHNSCGTAPGILMRVNSVGAALDVNQNSNADSNDCLIAVMPGVPAEMKPMFTQHVLPFLTKSGMAMRRKVIRSFGFGESAAESKLGDLTARARNPEVGITASEAVISLWVTARSRSADEAELLCNETCTLVKERLGDAVYGEGDDELYDVVAELLTRNDSSISLVEGATTGGQISMWMSESPKTASVIKSAMVIPGQWDSNALRAWNLKLATVSVSSSSDWLQWATAVGNEVRLHSNADFVLLSSPFHDDRLDLGFVVRRGYVAVSTADEIQSFDVSMSGNLAIFRQRAARTALNRLRLILKSKSTIETKLND
jgi:nicotinamide-nucleotide amidase